MRLVQRPPEPAPLEALAREAEDHGGARSTATTTGAADARTATSVVRGG